MLQKTPWYGTGVGTFWFGWQPFRVPTEGSAGFFAHNDYLQFWIETGWPGLILLLSVLAASVAMFFKALRDSHKSGAQKIEMTGAFAAFSAVAIHTFFTFNFYVLPILILCGLALGRFHQLAASDQDPELSIQPMKFCNKPIYQVVVILLALFPLNYFLSVGLSYHYYKDGIAEMVSGDFKKADEALEKSVRFWDSTDIIWYSRADLYRKALLRLPPQEKSQREALFKKAQYYLQKAQNRNPFRPEISTIRGLLYDQNATLAGKNWREEAIGGSNTP